ncbi:MAG: ABC transporter ATP-binding protein [Candidatus Aminicenantes bacterium]|nr:MAG: ABC transporter ATP-binding protein [Candidatus Aminicenantes bacterium]
MSLIRLENVSKVYNSNGIELPAVKTVSFLVEKGEFLSIAGPSGSGKTTLLNIMGCLDLPSSGTVFLEGKQILFRKRRQLAEIRRDNIGFIFQTFNLVPVLTAFENVEFPLLLKTRMKAKERRRLVKEMLRDVGLEDLMQRKPSEMSGGQQQRVAIARALVKQPHIVLADEPTANLDSKTGREILELMQQLNRKTNTTFIFSTHDQMVMDFAQRLIRLRDGQIESDEKRG